MSQINIPRLPQAQKEYDQRQLNQMIQSLDQLIILLNSTYTPETLRNVQAIIKSIRVSDDSATASTITVTITDVAAGVFNLAHEMVVGANVPVELLTEPLVAQQGEIITVTPGHADRLHVVLSVLEISNNT